MNDEMNTMKLKEALKLAAAELESAYLNEREYHDRCDKRVEKLDEALGVVVKLMKSKLVDSLDSMTKGRDQLEREAALLSNAAEAQEEEEIHYEG